MILGRSVTVTHLVTCAFVVLLKYVPICSVTWVNHVGTVQCRLVKVTEYDGAWFPVTAEVESTRSLRPPGFCGVRTEGFTAAAPAGCAWTPVRLFPPTTIRSYTQVEVSADLYWRG